MRWFAEFWWVPVIVTNFVLDVLRWRRDRRYHREYMERFREEFGSAGTTRGPG